MPTISTPLQLGGVTREPPRGHPFAARAPQAPPLPPGIFPQAPPAVAPPQPTTMPPGALAGAMPPNALAGGPPAISPPAPTAPTTGLPAPDIVQAILSAIGFFRGPGGGGPPDDLQLENMFPRR